MTDTLLDILVYAGFLTLFFVFGAAAVAYHVIVRHWPEDHRDQSKRE
jgi:hypothetical protein